MHEKHAVMSHHVQRLEAIFIIAQLLLAFRRLGTVLYHATLQLVEIAHRGAESLAVSIGEEDYFIFLRHLLVFHRVFVLMASCAGHVMIEGQSSD